MVITDVRVRRVNSDGKMKAVVSITIDESFVVHDIKIIDGLNGLFVAMPSRKVGDSDYRDIAHPINSETRGYLQKVIFEAYNKELETAAETESFDGEVESLAPQE